MGRNYGILLLVLLSFSCAKPALRSDSEKAAAATEEDIGPGGVLDSDSGTALGLQSIYYDYRSAEATDAELRKLEGNLKILKQNPKAMVQLEGHCDQRGTDDINFKLGERRAQAVLGYLIHHGIAANRLSEISYGKTHLATPQNDDPARGRNRRVNFVLLAR